VDLPRARGRLLTNRGRTVLAAHCPLCGAEHRYDKGAAGGPETEELLARGFTDEWRPCQFDLPGNFWRIFVGRTPRRRPSRRPAPGQPPTPTR
jgi:hypothetical protein